ncbi:MAG: autotransporter domain-containing protein [Endomicrobia bacterium]|nr:autotransporter domain-containing protein [Endomicrobiia bacterium]
MAKSVKCFAALLFLCIFSGLSHSVEDQVSNFTELKTSVEVNMPDSILITVPDMSLTDMINASNAAFPTLIHSDVSSVLTGAAPSIFMITGAEYDFSGISFADSVDSALFTLESGATLRFLDQANFSNNTSTNSVILINGSSFYADAGADFSSNSNSDYSAGGVLNFNSGSAFFSGNAAFSGNSASAGNGGAIYASNASALNFEDASFTSNNAYLSGGALYLDSGSSVYFSGSAEFFNNTSYAGNGGAMALYDSAATFDGSTVFQGNKAGADGFFCLGGALYMKNGSAVFSDKFVTVFESNEADASAYASGGGFAAETDFGATQNITFCDTVFSQNKAWVGGGFYVMGDFSDNSASNITFNGAATFDSNSASGSGGGFYAGAATLAFNGEASFDANISQSGGGGFSAVMSNVSFNDGVLFTSNTAQYGGAANITASGVLFGGSAVFSNNIADGVSDASTINGGGALYLSYSTVTFSTGVYFNANKADNGGAILGYSGDLAGGNGLTVTFNGGAHFNNNEASDKGGALYAYATGEEAAQTQFNFSNAEFTGNKAGNAGGAIYAIGYSTDSFTNFVEININTAANGGGDNKTIFQGNTAKGSQSSAFYLDAFTTMTFVTGAGACVEMYDSMASADNSYVLVKGAGDFNMYADSNLNELLISGGNFNLKNGSFLHAGTFTADSLSTVNLRGNGANGISADVFDFDGLLKIDASPAGNITANTAVLGSSSGLDVMTDVTADKNYRQRIYKILGYGSLSGIFSQITLNDGLSLDDLADTYFCNYGDNGWITLTLNGLDKSTNFSGLSGKSFNQTQSARALDTLSSIIDINGDLGSMITLLDSVGTGSAAQRNGLTAVSGYFIANVIRSAAMQGGSNEIYDRIKYQTQDAKNSDGAWVQARGQYTSIASDDNSPGRYTASGAGVLAGYDRMFEAREMMGGLFMKYNSQSIDQVKNDATIKSFGAGFYGGLIKEQWEIKAMLSVEYGSFDTSRYIDFAGRRAFAGFDGFTIGLDAEGAYITYITDTIYLRPFAGLEFNNTSHAGFKESGAGDLSLDVKGGNYSRSLGRLGINVASDIGVKLEWYAGINGSCIIGGSEPQIDSVFGATDVTFSSKGAKEGVIIFGLSGGAAYKFLENMKAFANASFRVSSSNTGLYGNIGVRYMFLGK